MPPQSIDEVLRRLDRIIADARQKERRLGYFAALYRDVTAWVAATIEDGGFRDGPRMERLDVAFASRYFEALEARGTEAGPPRSWTNAFEAAGHWRPIILQHLLLGVNAHINLDLGIAAVEVVSNFSGARARADAWAVAQKLAPLETDRRAQLVEAKDRETARRAEKILQPGGRLFVPLLLCVRLREESDVPSAIAALSATCTYRTP